MHHPIVRTVSRNLTCALLAVVSFFAVHALAGDGFMTTAPHAAAPTVASADPAAALVARHGCWTGEAPADMQGQLPGHVVVTSHGRTTYAGARVVGKALEQVFEGVEHGLTVHAFCR